MTRQAWRDAMPALTTFYGLKPWDLERMTYAELDVYWRHMVDATDARREAAVKARRRKAG